MADFTALREYMDSLATEKHLPAGDILVYHEGKPVFRHLVGYRDSEKTQPLTEDTVYMLYSCTKPVTAVAAMQLIEQGRLGLDAPVMTYLPELAEAFVMEGGRRVTVGHTMTVRHLLTMSAGFDYNVQMSSVLARQKEKPDATTREMVAAFVQEPLLFRPGTRFEYSLCMDVLAAVVEAAAGMSFGTYLQEHIFAPLGATDITFRPTPEQQARFVTQYVCNPERGLVEIPGGIGAFLLSSRYESGGAGLYATTESLGKFVAAMSCGGVAADGTRILGDKSVAMLCTHQLDFLTTPAFAEGDYGYSFGMRTRRDDDPRRAGAFGWDGAAGAYVLMNPAARVGIAYCQQTKGWPLFFQGIHQSMLDLAYAALGV